MQRPLYQPGYYQSRFFPRWISNPSMGMYFGALLVVSILFNRYMLNWWWMLCGVIEIFAFFYGSWRLTHDWARLSSKRFERQLVQWSFLIRLVYVLISYYVFTRFYGGPFGWDDSDATFYEEIACYVSKLLREGTYTIWESVNKYCGYQLDLSDAGYAIYLGIIYYIVDDSILIARVLKCIWGAWTALLIYRVAVRNFGEAVGRMAGIFMMLMPNLWYYCGTQLKEVEMVFLGVLFVEQADQMLRSRQFTAWKVGPLLLIALVLFTIRTPLAVVCILSLLFSLTMSSQRVVGWGKRIVVGTLAIAVIGLTMGNRLEEESQALLQKARSNEQSQNMEWRSKRSDGANQFAKYAGAAVFAPLIFTIPFPTMVETPNQEQQKLLHGGNYTKNILSGFVLLAMFVFLLSGDWRNHLVPLSFMLGYLVVLAFSSFAQSERFHQPILPLELMFAAYMIVNMRPKHRRWFNMWLMLMGVAAIAWSWFKLAGRGMA